LVKPPQSTSDLRSEVEVAIAALQIFRYACGLRPVFFLSWRFHPSTSNELRSLTLFAKSAAGAEFRWRTLRRSNYRNAIRSLLYDRMVSELDDKKTRNLGFRRRFRHRSFGVNRNYQRDSALCFVLRKKKFSYVQKRLAKNRRYVDYLYLLQSASLIELFFTNDQMKFFLQEKIIL
jgi:hypothetical protein